MGLAYSLGPSGTVARVLPHERGITLQVEARAFKVAIGGITTTDAFPFILAILEELGCTVEDLDDYLAKATIEHEGGGA